ncbi:MAG: HD domain-containing protein [Oscillospiraceae bacterium]|jgi:uncharacterized protein|nr:HD domain-containing protein [Oscillospiraceae bacterium]
MIDWKVLDTLAQKQMSHRKAHPMRETGFIYRHGQRVAASVTRLRARVTDDASYDDALRIAGLFHDIGKGIEPHARSGALLARDLLIEYLPKALLDAAIALIANHCNHDAPGLFDHIFQDADLLDHFGSIEIVLSAQYGAYNEKGIDAVLGWYENEFLPYIAGVRRRIRTEAGRAVLEEKIAFTLAFVARLKAEAAGEYII